MKIGRVFVCCLLNTSADQHITQCDAGGAGATAFGGGQEVVIP